MVACWQDKTENGSTVAGTKGLINDMVIDVSQRLLKLFPRMKGL